MNSLENIYAVHDGKVSDKWQIYLREYDRIFSPYRLKPVNLLEIGIQNGGSMEIWANYFAEAQHLVGCDINSKCSELQFDDRRIHIVVGDSNECKTQEEIEKIAHNFDIIIDDGSHTSSDIVRSFAHFFSKLNYNGVYIVEDLHCSYWQKYEGGLYDPYSANSFFKCLADVVNYEHWGIEKTQEEFLQGIFTKHKFSISEHALAEIHSIEFLNSICVIRKHIAEDNLLGARVIAGIHEPVVADMHLLKTSAVRPVESNNPWAAMAVAPAEQFTQLNQTIAEYEVAAAISGETIRLMATQIGDLEGVMTKRSAKIADLESAIESRNDEIGRFGDLVEERSAKIAELESAIQSRNDEIGVLGALAGEHSELRQEIKALRASLSWRLSGPLRWLTGQGVGALRLAKLTPKALHLGGGVMPVLKRGIAVFQQSGVDGIRQEIAMVQAHGSVNVAPGSGAHDRNDYTEWVRRYDTLTPEMRSNMRKRVADFANKPLISVVMPVYNANPVWLQEAIDSIKAQIYPHWELCIADDASPDPRIKPLLQAAAALEPRIKTVFRPKNGHISAASNSAIELATGEWLALLDHDDLLPEHALYWVVDAINQHPEAKMIYSDEDKLNEAGLRINPYFKCDWNRDLFYSHNMFSHLGVYKTELVRDVGCFRMGYEGSQDYDLALRCLERSRAVEIHHIPRVLYHWRIHPESTAHKSESKPYAMVAGERALNDHFSRIGTACQVEYVDFGYRPYYTLPDAVPLVSIIIPTRNGFELLSRCIKSIIEKTTYQNYEIIIVDNGSDEQKAIEYLRGIGTEENIRVLRDDREFNYSALNNLAVREAHGSVIALLNNDIEVISPDWLSTMVSFALQPGVGAVGAKLFYPNGLVQHAGVILGIGGVANHAHRNYPAEAYGYFTRATLTQGFSAVTGACLVVSKEIYEAVDGLNEKNLAVAFNDIDFCLKLMQAGFRNIWTPDAKLYHYESATRGHEDNPDKVTRLNKESEYIWSTWRRYLEDDPAYSPNLTDVLEDFSYAWPPRVRR